MLFGFYFERHYESGALIFYVYSVWVIITEVLVERVRRREVLRVLTEV